MTTKNVSRKKQSLAVRKMVTAAMLGAVTAVLAFAPIGMIPLPPPLLHATTVHLPVILAALVEGPLVGLFVGLVFGVCSFINAWSSGAVGLTLFFRNPLISIVPRMVVPLVALGVYLLWKKLVRPSAVSDKLGAAVASALSAILTLLLRTFIGERYYKAISSYRYLAQTIGLMLAASLCNLLMAGAWKYAALIGILALACALYRRGVATLWQTAMQLLTAGRGFMKRRLGGKKRHE